MVFSDRHKVLASAVFDTQVPDDLPWADVQRLQNSGKGDRALSVEDRRLIWDNPIARAAYLSGRTERRRVWSERLIESGETLSLMPLVAGTDSTIPLTVQNSSFTVAIEAEEDSDQDNLVVVTVAEELRSSAPDDAAWVVRDDAGRVWATGVADKAGRFASSWEHSERPRRLIAETSLHLGLL